MRWILPCVIAIGCAGAPRLRYEQAVRFADPSEPQVPEPAGTCPATLHVRVVDEAQRPVAGAEVTVHQQLRVNAPSLVPSTTAYRSQPVRTDARGRATVCHPDDMPPRDHEVFAARDGGHVEARLGTRTGRLASPFVGPLVLAATTTPHALDPL